MISPLLGSSQKKRSSRRDRLKIPKHDRRKRYRKHRGTKSAAPSSSKRRRNIRNGQSSEDEEFTLDREKLKAALKRDTRSPIARGTSLKKKLQGVKETVSAFIDLRSRNEKDEFNNEIKEILHNLTADKPSSNHPPEVEMTSDLENDTISLEEQELRLIALKSAIVRKHEARKRKKLNDQKPYSPTDNEIIEVLSRSPSQCKDEPDNMMEISPINSPASFDKSLLPVDMELVSSDSTDEPIFLNDDTKSRFLANDHQEWHPIEKMPLSIGHFETDQISNFEIFKPIFVTAEQDQQQPPVKIPAAIVTVTKEQVKTEKEKESDNLLDEEEEENALRALLLAKLNSPKSRNKKPNSVVPVVTKTMPETIENHEIKVNSESPDPNIEADEMRKVLLSSMNMKDNFSRVQQKENREINLPKIALNLKDAVKRIKSKYMPTPLSNRSKRRLSSANSNLIVIDLNKNIQANSEIADKEDAKDIPVQKEEISLPKDDTIQSVPEQPIKTVVSKPISKSQPVKTILKQQVAKAKIPAATNKLKKTNTPPTKIVKPIPLPVPSLKRPHNSVESDIPIKRQKIEFNNPILMKPVNKLVIQLRPSDSESDGFYSSDDNESVPLQAIKIREIDNASPSSIAMDSPSYAPCSPVQMHNSTSNDTESQSSTTDFQKKLDEFLKSARTKVEQQTTTTNENKPDKTRVVTPATPLVNFYFRFFTLEILLFVFTFFVLSVGSTFTSIRTNGIS